MDADATATNEGANWVDARDGSGNSNLGAATSFTGDTTDFNSAVFDFWHFLTEEAFDKLSRTTREDELSAFVATFNILDVNLNTATNGVILAVDLLGARDDATGATEVDADETWLNAGDSTGNDGADFIFEGGEDGVVFGFAEALDDNLLSGHSGNAAKSGDFAFFFNYIANLGTFTGFLLRDFGRWVVSEAIFDDFASDKHIGFASFGVKNGADIHVTITVIFTPSGGNSLFNNI